MAQFITNHIKASKHVIDALINTTPGHNFEGSVDFNLIVPTPETVSQEEGPAEDAYAKGMLYWRDWNEENWATKWNAGDTERRSEGTVYFQTANSPSFPVFEALSLKFPGEKIYVCIAGERADSFAMQYLYLNGEQFENSILRGDRAEMKKLNAKVRLRRLK